MNFKLIFLPVALVVEVASVCATGFECGFGNWVFDRKLGDPNGKDWQSRKEALRDSKEEGIKTQ